MTRNTEQEWIFTFGSGKHSKFYYTVFGTWETARAQMMQRFGSRWAFQYPSKEAAGVEQFGLVELKKGSEK